MSNCTAMPRAKQGEFLAYLTCPPPKLLMSNNISETLTTNPFLISSTFSRCPPRSPEKSTSANESVAKSRCKRRLFVESDWEPGGRLRDIDFCACATHRQGPTTVQERPKWGMRTWNCLSGRERDRLVFNLLILTISTHFSGYGGF